MLSSSLVLGVHFTAQKWPSPGLCLEQRSGRHADAQAQAQLPAGDQERVVTVQRSRRLPWWAESRTKMFCCPGTTFRSARAC